MTRTILLASERKVWLLCHRVMQLNVVISSLVCHEAMSILRTKLFLGATRSYDSTVIG
jgi:hypothetical protein